MEIILLGIEVLRYDKGDDSRKEFDNKTPFSIIRRQNG